MGKEVWDDIKKTVASPGMTRIYVMGPPGVGKTHYALQVLSGGDPTKVSQTTLNEDMSVQEAMGHWLPQGDKFVLHDGPFVKAFRNGTPLLINEVSRASQAVQDCLLGVLDDPEIAAMTLPTGETIRPGKGFRTIATSNSPFSELPDALRDRFDADFVITHPHPRLVDHINGLLPKLGTVIANSYDDPKKAISPRRAIAFVKLMRAMGHEAASRVAFGARSKDMLLVMKSQGLALI